MRTVAVVVIKSKKALDWLGHMPVLNWSVTQLLEVRGVGKIVCAVSRDLASRVTEFLASEKIEVVSIPAEANKDDAVFERWLVSAAGPASDADVVAVIRSTSPFLPAAKVEGCIDMVSRNLADSCGTARVINTRNDFGKTVINAEVPCCRVFAPARVKERCRHRPLTVNLIESLDISVGEDYRVARALVAAGQV